MNLNIREIDPEARGLLYRLQAEQNLPNLANFQDWSQPVSHSRARHVRCQEG